MKNILLFLVFCLIASMAHAGSNNSFLINNRSLSPIITVTTIPSSASCASTELYFTFNRRNHVSIEQCENGRCFAANRSLLRFMDRVGPVAIENITLGSGDPVEGDVQPVVGPDGILWVCREDQNQECLCIRWPF